MRLLRSYTNCLPYGIFESLYCLDGVYANTSTYLHSTCRRWFRWPDVVASSATRDAAVSLPWRRSWLLDDRFHLAASPASEAPCSTLVSSESPAHAKTLVVSFPPLQSVPVIIGPRNKTEELCCLLVTIVWVALKRTGFGVSEVALSQLCD